MFALHEIQELRRRTTRAATRTLLRDCRADARSGTDIRATQVRRVLVCRPNHRLGNLLLLTPLLQELQRTFPDAAIDLVVAGDDGAALFRTFGNIRNIHTLSRRMVRHPLQTARIAIRIRRAKYDLAIDPCAGSQSSRWLVAFANATRVIAAVEGGPAADQDRPTAGPPAPSHMAQWPVYLLRRAVGASGSDYPVLDIALSAAEHYRGQQILNVLTAAGTTFPPIIGIFADARGDKRYAEAWWMRFIDTLRQCAPGHVIVEIAPPDGRSRLGARFPIFFSPDVREVAAVISRMACFISADCGVMHLACASGTPTLGLFSVTDVARYAPYGNGSCGIVTTGKRPEEVARLVPIPPCASRCRA